ncbi:type IVa pilus pseudopilin TppA [Aeromonas sp. MR19]|uniref:Type IVa pilus pseudopilin TppA n=1 Tax=Aeromonas bestiarum TaxID=105751 RepID=A0ABT7Q1F5_9GAMM|nr:MULTISPECIES: type IVa pilus pseudopilin TppA [Aeromonas]MCH7375417.1 type IVa pilus pseudopilin TppA [Aeromonas sp. MR19]MDM5072988.1 type IVa pilus pseudopilin TppA [Aeromonas bestiarum]MDM5090346.1 type IVa pilus pseudopilin TppA [Aeromonas bestiarum]
MDRGFSLMELMIAVAVMAILTVIAYPSYNNYIASAKRAEAKATLLEAAQYLERQFTAEGNYDGGNLASAGLATLPKEGGEAYYNLALNASGGRYTLTAIPTGAMDGDPCGLLTLDQGGQQGVSGATMTAAECW